MLQVTQIGIVKPFKFTYSFYYYYFNCIYR